MTTKGLQNYVPPPSIRGGSIWEQKLSRATAFANYGKTSVVIDRWPILPTFRDQLVHEIGAGRVAKWRTKWPRVDRGPWWSKWNFDQHFP